MKRALAQRSQGKLLTVWVPVTLLPQLDEAVKKADCDRSKFIRNAIREKLARLSVNNSSESHAR